SLERLNARPVVAACFGLLTAVAAAAAVAFAWPVAVTGALAFGLNLATIGAASATAAGIVTGALSYRFGHGLFCKPQFRGLKDMEHTLDAENTTLSFRQP